MRKNISGAYFIILILFIIASGQIIASQALLAAQKTTSQKKIFILADAMDAPPFKTKNSNGEPAGIFHDIIIQVFKYMKMPILYKGYPWKRAQLLVKMKKADALITVPTPERLQYLVSGTEPVLIAHGRMFTQRDNPNIARISTAKSMSDIKDLKFISFLGGGWAKKILKGFNLEWFPDLPSTCKALAAHRGDICFENRIVMMYAIKNIKKNQNALGLDFDNLVSFKAPVPDLVFTLLIRKDSGFVYLLPEFDSIIRTMHENGEIDRIINKWIK